MPPKVSVIIPTRKKVQLTRQCLKSLFDSHPADDLQVLVFEHGGDECGKMIEAEFADKPVTRHESGEDWGYSKINNEAAKLATAPYLLLLNNDTICRKGFLARMLEAMETHPDVGIVGAKLVYLNGGIQHLGVVFRSDGMPVHLGYGKRDDGTYEPANRDDYFDAVTFACALIRKELWDAVGGLDEAYHFNYEDVDFCLKAREMGFRCLTAHKALVVHLEAQSSQLRKNEDAIWPNLKILRDKWITTGKLESLCHLRLHPMAGTMRDDRLNIAFVPSSKAAGVPWWRMDLPARKLAKHGLANVTSIYGDADAGANMATLENADVAIFQGFTQEWVLRIASMRAVRPFAFVYDYDDHPLHISPFAEAYRWFGVREVELADPRGRFWLWRDGETGFDVERNRANRQRQMHIFHEADLLTTSTPPLVTYMKTLNTNVALLPNYIDFSVYRNLRRQRGRKPGRVRIGWHGGDNHLHDIATVGPWLTEYVNSHDVELLLFGAYYRAAFPGIDKNKVIEEQWVHVEAFPYKLACLGIDVAIVPLADPNDPHMAFGRFKSSIKFLEGAATGSACLVAAGREAYAVCEDAENCLTYATKDEFMEKLDALCSDETLRLRIADQGYDYIRQHHDADKHIHRWLEAYQRAIEIHKERSEKARLEAEAQEADRPASSNAVPEGAPA